MNRHQRRTTVGRALALVVLVALVAAGCSRALATASPSSAAVPVTPAPATPSASASASGVPTARPSPAATPTPAPTAEPIATATPCAIAPETGPLPTDRLVNVVASTTDGADMLTFVFGNVSVPGPGGPPTGELSAAEPPYTFGPSGLPITMAGDHVLQIVFRGMSLQADTMEPVYQGPPDISPGYPSLQHAVEYDESEGVIGWYVGYDGTGCVTLERVGDDVTLTFPHAG